MKKLKNPFETKGGKKKCFGCSSNNPYSLKMEFFENDNEIWSEWEPRSEFDSWENVVHGGIQACLVDETGGWLVSKNLERFTVTKRIDIKYIKTLHSNSGKIKTKAELNRIIDNIAEINIEIYNSDNILCTQATGYYYMFSEEDSINKYNIPKSSDF